MYQTDSKGQNPALEQLELSKDGNTIAASWEKSFDGKTWEHDFDIAYTRRRT